MIHKAKKSLGQNFLKSKEALLMMCQAGEVKNGDTVIEIGPGKGALTEKLLERASKVIAIEKDRDLIDLLNEKFAEEAQNGKFVLINQDILDFDPKDYELSEGKYKIVANIPYNITGLIIKKFLSEVNRPSNMTLLVQKEVAERIVARDNKESILSLSVKAYGEPKYMMKVHKRFFSPSPKVDSAIISIKNISQKYFATKDEEGRFFEIIKAGFLHKRKVLSKNLEDITKNKEKIKELFKKLNLSEKVRAEDLKFGDWIVINKELTDK
jgi:16S rRNA (adenine1518-N6/adenine1519-N6)-dimethyltransferase